MLTPVAIVGNINLDIKTSLIPVHDTVLSDGETGVDEIYESLGGGAANTALAAAQLGGRVSFFGCVGDDELGDRLEAALTSFGITAHLARKPMPTGRSLALHWNNGARHFLSSLPNNRSLTAADIDVDTIIKTGCHQLLRADVWFSEAMLAEGNYELLHRTRAAGIETYLDINWDPEWSIPGSAARIHERCRQLASVLPLVAVAHGNQHELAYFTRQENIQDACRFLLDAGCTTVVIHRGAQGAASYNAAEGWIEVPAVPVPVIVCPTGCGDVFCAAHMLLRHLDTPQRLSACARIAADHLRGTRILIPRLTDCRHTHNKEAP